MNHPANILIVTDGHPCRNPRPVKEASALANAGYNVTLLYIRNHPPSVKIDAELLAGAPFQSRSLDFLATDYNGYSRSLRARIASFLARKAIRFHLESPSALGPARLLLNAAQRIPADLTIVHNALPHWVGLQLLRTGRRVAVDIEDWNSEDLLPHARRHLPLRLLRRTEHFSLHNAVYTSTTSHALADALHTRYGGTRPNVITNSFPLQPIQQQLQPGTPPAFLWFSQTIGPGRGLEAFIAAWSLTREPSRLVLLGNPSVGYKDRLLNALPPDFRLRVTLLPLVQPGELPSVIAAHDVGLALEETSILNRDLTITNKILQYLNAGLAVVASSTSGQREVLTQDPDAGVIVRLDDPASFAKILDTLVMSPQALAHRRQAARRLAAQKYCWEKEAPALLSLVAIAIATRPNSS